jgi:hypothetical protein
VSPIVAAAVQNPAARTLSGTVADAWWESAIADTGHASDAEPHLWTGTLSLIAASCRALTGCSRARTSTLKI